MFPQMASRLKRPVGDGKAEVAAAMHGSFLGTIGGLCCLAIISTEAAATYGVSGALYKAYSGSGYCLGAIARPLLAEARTSGPWSLKLRQPPPRRRRRHG